MTRYTALLLAGSRPGGDAFAQSHGAEMKALIPIAGEPMVLRPLRALLGSKRIAAVRLLTQAPDRIAAVLPGDDRWSVERSGETIAATLEAICADPDTPWPLLATTADHALLDTAMVEDFCARAEGADLAIGLVERRALQARLPATRRTWIRLKGGAYSGANIFALGSPRAVRAIQLWREMEQDRKKGWRLLFALGWPGLLGLLRVRTLDQTLDAMGQRLGLTIRTVEMTDPLAAVDVDKPEDYALVTAILEGRA